MGFTNAAQNLRRVLLATEGRVNYVVMSISKLSDNEVLIIGRYNRSMCIVNSMKCPGTRPLHLLPASPLNLCDGRPHSQSHWSGCVLLQR
jgi:hypothetical protein